MLSSRIGRFAIQHANSSKLQRVEIAARVLGGSNSTYQTAPRRLFEYSQSNALRRYATDQATTKPKAHTGRTTTRKSGTTKKAAPKKTVKKPAKKAAKKKPAKKAVKPKRRVKKVLTPEEKQKAKIKDLKLKALVAPHGLPSTAWGVLSSESTKGASGAGALVTGVKEASVKYKNLLPEEREHYNHLANENKAKNEQSYKAWVQSYTPDQIRVANGARASLRRITGRARHWSALQDDRQIKRPVPPRLLFNTDRWASGDFGGMKLTDVPQLLNREWDALPEAQKKVYQDRHAAAQAKYASDFTAVYGANSRPAKRRTAKSNAAAAGA